MDTATRDSDRRCCTQPFEYSQVCIDAAAARLPHQRRRMKTDTVTCTYIQAATETTPHRHIDTAIKETTSATTQQDVHLHPHTSGCFERSLLNPFDTLAAAAAQTRQGQPRQQPESPTHPPHVRLAVSIWRRMALQLRPCNQRRCPCVDRNGERPIACLFRATADRLVTLVVGQLSPVRHAPVPIRWVLAARGLSAAPARTARASRRARRAGRGSRHWSFSRR